MAVSDPNNPAAPAAKARPSSVTISSYLLFLVAAVFALGAIVSLSTLGTVSDVYRDAYAGTDLEGTEGVVTAFGVGGAVLQLLFAAAFVALGLFNNRGRNASRIVTWVFGALGLCCAGLGVGGSAVGNMGATGSTGDAPSGAEVTEMMNEALPGWVEPVGMITNVIALIALLVAVVLLALPPSNEFFRKPQAAWEPPVPGGTYPGYPPAPQGGAPGYPTQGGEPGYPPPGGAPGQPPPGGDPGYPPPPGDPSGPNPPNR
jgi:hypothetical protein